jgi:HEAT repeat protein
MSQFDDLLEVQAPCADLKSVPPEAVPAREPAQRTLSAIGDVGVAVSDRMGQAAPARRRSWFALLSFTLLVYGLTLAAGWLVGLRDTLALAYLPLASTLPAFAAFWFYQQWKVRAQEREAKAKAWQKALETVAYESANAANAIRANLLGMYSAHSDAARAAHLQEIDLAARRLEAVVARVPRLSS